MVKKKTGLVGLHSGRQIRLNKGKRGYKITRSQTALEAYDAIIKKYGEIVDSAKYEHRGKGNWVRYSMKRDATRTGKTTTDIKKWRTRPHKLDFKGKDTKGSIVGRKPAPTIVRKRTVKKVTKPKTQKLKLVPPKTMPGPKPRQAKKPAAVKRKQVLKGKRTYDKVPQLTPEELKAIKQGKTYFNKDLSKGKYKSAGANIKNNVFEILKKHYPNTLFLAGVGGYYNDAVSVMWYGGPSEATVKALKLHVKKKDPKSSWGNEFDGTLSFNKKDEDQLRTFIRKLEGDKKLKSRLKISYSRRLKKSDYAKRPKAPTMKRRTKKKPIAIEREPIFKEYKRKIYKAFLVTGKTYPIRRDLNALGGRWNPENKGYFIPATKAKELNRMKKQYKLNVVAFKSKVNPFIKLTDEDRLKFRMERQERKAQAVEKGIEKKASIDGPWLKSSPFTSIQVSSYNAYTHFPIDINKQFNEDARRAGESVKASFKTTVPEVVKNALKNYRKELYYYYLEHGRARRTAPPWTVTGRANYKGKPDKAAAIERNANESLKKAEDILEKSISRGEVAETKARAKTKGGIDVGDAAIIYWTSGGRKYKANAKAVKINVATVLFALVEDYGAYKKGSVLSIPMRGTAGNRWEFAEKRRVNAPSAPPNGVNIKDLSGIKLKKALGIYKAVKRYHNKNASGGNFAIELRFSSQLGDGIELSGMHDTDGIVRVLDIGPLYSPGAPIITKENYKTMTFEKVIEVIKKAIGFHKKR